MTDNEVISYLKLCQRSNKNVNIVLSGDDKVKFALNLLVNSSKHKFKIFCYFKQASDGVFSSSLLSYINDELFIRNAKEFINIENSRIEIISNNKDKVCASPFYQRVGKSNSESLSLNLADSGFLSFIKQHDLTSEFIVADDSMVMFFADDEIFVNFNSEKFSKTLASFVELSKNNNDKS
ncbi:hypothetical protein ORJ04_21370 [Rheinheimera baltica]|uniref:Uncharacterized protein n=1 Tax=Rheinheimera baltica TaxID=67576 RepID=A0ABT9I526_9GAMM|nr:hypothetical protein [Rheinheimera baltica]MDP5138502.1 hypothetical protein [Rheinheimera baltica]MDP5150602.1 hypothetical protein [Rheinheimera baltica]